MKFQISLSVVLLALSLLIFLAAKILSQNSKGSRYCRFWPVGCVAEAGQSPKRACPVAATQPRAKIGATLWALATSADSGVGSAVKARSRGFSCLAALDSAEVADRAAPSSFETGSRAFGAEGPKGVGDQLVAAAGRGDVAALRRGLAEAVDPDGYLPLVEANGKGHTATVELLRSALQKGEPVIAAVSATR